MKGKLKIVIPLAVLILLGGAYKVVLAKPSADGKAKVDGTVYVLPKEFLINLSDQHFAKLSVALVLPKDEAPAAVAGSRGMNSISWCTLTPYWTATSVKRTSLAFTSVWALISLRSRARRRLRRLRFVRSAVVSSVEPASSASRASRRAGSPSEAA